MTGKNWTTCNRKHHLPVELDECAHALFSNRRNLWRHFLLPKLFEIWLVREEWAADKETPFRAKNLFERAITSQECRYAEDIPGMREFIYIFCITKEKVSKQ